MWMFFTNGLAGLLLFIGFMVVVPCIVIATLFQKDVREAIRLGVKDYWDTFKLWLGVCRQLPREERKKMNSDIWTNTMYSMHKYESPKKRRKRLENERRENIRKNIAEFEEMCDVIQAKHFGGK